MSKNYRFKTEVGIDKEVRLQIEQDFDFLEILSLKLRQEDIYDRYCADYGVVAGRVVANGGFGIPNVNVSVFVPLDNIDENDPIITTLYPYKTVIQKNEDGYRYNLLPYKKEYGGHNPTGTFPDREDVLTRKEVLYVYEKYYKYTVKTNNSGDFMIVGVPLGTQQLVFDLDLSNIGEFSLRPADLIRMGLGNEQQFDGQNFRTSENLDSLPQIINTVKQVEVNSFWGQNELCDVGITRIDLDLRDLGIDILPHCVFMGSIMSTSEDDYIKRSCKPKNNMGEFCSLITGPGVILSIRHTIEIDFSGNPILEEYRLEDGGNIIDENGVWLTELPMNLDYVTTNEFGEQIISSDPDIGIPTNSKYRFKIKYAEKGQDIDRANYLVPNIKEHGWVDDGEDLLNVPSDADRNKSYAFSLDWNDYYDINAAINCEDTFYKFSYNRVYTVASHIDRFKSGVNRNRHLGIKQINNRDCQSEQNKLPTNEAFRDNTFLNILFNFLINALQPIFYVLIVVLHVLVVLWPLIFALIALINFLINIIILPICLAVSVFSNNVSAADCIERTLDTGNLDNTNPFRSISLPMLSYPDCNTCDCEESPLIELNEYSELLNNLYSSIIAPISLSSSYKDEDSSIYTFCDIIPTDEGFDEQDIAIRNRLVCSGYDNPQSNNAYGDIIDTNLGDFSSEGDKITWYKSPAYVRLRKNTVGGKRYDWLTSTNYTWAQGLNLMNRRSMYFGDSGEQNFSTTTTSAIQTVTVNDNFGPSNSTPWMDSCFIMVTESSESFDSGQMFTFNNTTTQLVNEVDPNIENGLTGTTQHDNNNYIQKPVRYVNRNGSESFGTAQIVNSGDTNTIEYKFTAGVEYFQVITGMTISELQGHLSPTDNQSILRKFIINHEQPYECFRDQAVGTDIVYDGSMNPLLQLVDSSNLKVLFCVRGVDTHTPRQKIKYDLSKLFGYGLNDLNTFSGNITVEGMYKMNIPIQPNTTQPSNTQSIWRNSENTPTPHYLKNQDYILNSFTDTNNISTANHDKSALYHKSFTLEIDSNDWTPLETYAFNKYVSLDKQTPLTTVDGDPITDGISSNSENVINTYGQRNIEGCGYQYSSDPNGGSIGQGDDYTLNDEMDVITISPGYFSPRLSNILGAQYPNQPKITISDSENIVFRSDRIPLSDTPDELVYSSPITGNIFYRCDFRQYGLHLNLRQRFFNITDSGDIQETETMQPLPSDNDSGNTEDLEGELVSSVMNTFTCDGMVPLSCYSGSGESFGVEDPCVTEPFSGVDGEDRVVNGCYVFVKKIFFGIPGDLFFLREYLTRLKINFALCQGVISEGFQNNWINGVLYMPSFQKTALFFSDPDDENFNKIERYQYCGDPQSSRPQVRYQGPLYFNTDTNSFYYRSAPYNDNTEEFIGQVPGKETKSIGANDSNIWFPTTIMELGPRDEYAKELSLSGDFDGYIMDKIPTTSYKNNSAITMLFVISRIANPTIIDLIISFINSATNPLINNYSGVGMFFGRANKNFDGRASGDYVQMISINSEFGVIPYIDGNYDADISVEGGAFGIWFKSFTNDRRIVTDGVISFTDNPEGPTNTFGYANTQEVPFYMWTISENDPGLIELINQIGQPLPDPNYLFGSEKNNWNTGSSKIYTVKYQGDDFFNGAQQTYMMPDSGYGLGYIYNRDVDDPQKDVLPVLTSNGRDFKVGGPFHYYFGLKRGKSAMDRFRKKYLFIDLNE